MTPSTIKSLIRDHRGPIRVVMSDGREFLVHDPEHLLVTSTHLTLGLDPDDTGLPTRSRYLDARAVTQVEPASDGNGSDR